MPSKSEAILSSHRDAATRITKHFSAKHGLSLKPNDALDVVALVLGATNWKTLRAMAAQGRAPRMVDVGGAAAVEPLSIHFVPAGAGPNSLASFVVGGDHAGIAVRLFGSVVGRAGYHVYDAIGAGNPDALLKAMCGQDRLGRQVVSAPIPATADVLLLDERAFDDPKLLAQVVGSLKEDCRVVVYFSEWRPVSKNAEGVASIVEILADLKLAPLVFRDDGSMHAVGPSQR